MMKLMALFLLAGCLQLSAKTEAQSISISLNNATLAAAFTEIQQQTPYRFVYTNEQLTAASKITINVQNVSLEKILELCFKDQPLSYTIEDKFIIVKAREKKINLSSLENEVRGKVLNEKDEPVAGASIALKGSQRGSATDGRGEFLLADVPAGSIIVISSIGYESREIIIGNNRYLIIRLSTAVNGLDEMVIKGYYNTSKRLNTGSVGRITADDISKQPVANVLGALEGRMTGIYVSQNTGMPGGGFTVQLRGKNSLRQNGNFVLYIVDGVPFSSKSFASLGYAILQDANPLNSINPSDIQSIEVLKDADATAIYGSRGSNGVVLITTKKGVQGKTKVNFNYYTGIGQVAKKLQLLNTPQYLAVRHEAFQNDGINLTPANARDLLVWDTSRYTDWQKKLIGGTAHINDVQVSIAGGSASTQFLIGGALHRETTIFPGNFSDGRASANMSFSHNTENEKFHLLFSANYSNERNNLLAQDLTTNALIQAPDAPDFLDASNNLLWPAGESSNPYIFLKRKYKANTNNLISNLVLRYSILPNLQIKISGGYTVMTRSEIQTTPKVSINPTSATKASAIFADINSSTWIIEPQLEWDKKLGPGKISLLAGATFQQSRNNSQTLNGSGYTSDALIETIAGAATVTAGSTIASQYLYNAIYARLGYNIMDRYLLNVTARRDGSSRFGQDKQFANFGALGIAWIFSSEKFIASRIPWLSFGKIRSSFGTTGNDQIGDYQYLPLWSATLAYQGVGGLYPNQIGNPDYAWERNKKFEVSLDLGFVKDRILFSASYYKNRSDNQLVSYGLPSSSGFSNVQNNLPAIILNYGWEFELNTININHKNVRWRSSFNLTIPRNKLKAYPNIEGSDYATVYTVGKSLYTQKVIHYLSVDPSTGIYNYQDANNNGSGLDYPGDLQALKEIGQKYYGGIQNSIQYKNFQLDVFIQFVKQTGKNYKAVFGMPGLAVNQPVAVLSRWQKPGDVSSVQRFSETPASSSFIAYSTGQRFTDLSFTDASFLRLKNVAVSYNVPAKWNKKWKIQNSRIYIQAQNLFTLTHYLGLDPEFSSNLALVPPLRVITCGLSITL